uniref:Uncharacterized protein n=1 Tax=Nephila pilipes TaxID=299642 RepID=A0A8X6NE74_NEPPI|nr:hypothetical protein NPIL_31851 [Nephila pilipes]
MFENEIDLKNYAARSTFRQETWYSSEEENTNRDCVEIVDTTPTKKKVHKINLVADKCRIEANKGGSQIRSNLEVL